MTKNIRRSERVRGAGVDLHVVRAGDDAGPPVVLLHGFPEFWYSWRRQIAALADAGFSVWAADLRGYNLSDRPEGMAAYQLPLLVADVAALVRATGQGRAHVVGHDWGGVIAWAFAGAFPELLDRLVVLNAPHPALYFERAWRSPAQMLRSSYAGFFQLPALPERALSVGNFAAVRQMLRRTPWRRGAFSDADLREYVAALSRPGALAAALNYYRALARFPKARRLARRAAHTDAETLVIWGERDVALGVELLDGLERFAPRVRVHRLPDAGHWVQNEAPKEVNSALLNFLGRGKGQGKRLPDEGQKERLGELLHDALNEIRHLGWGGHAKQAADLADALGSLPREVYGWGAFDWGHLRRLLANYQEQYPDRRGRPDYAAQVERIRDRRP